MVKMYVLHVLEGSQVEVCTCYSQGNVNMYHAQQQSTMLLNVVYFQGLQVFLYCTKILLLDNI